MKVFMVLRRSHYKKANYNVFLQCTVLSYTAAWRDTYGTSLGYHEQELTSKIKLLIFLIGKLSVLLSNFIFSSPLPASE